MTQRKLRIMRCLVGSTLLAVATAGPAVAQRLSSTLDPTEQAIVAHVDANQDEALDLLIKVVNINSGTMNFEGVREVGRVFETELEGLGFTTAWVDGSEFDRAGHLMAERSGNGPRLLLIGHLDTVFEPDSAFQTYKPQSDTLAGGPGIVDMKGGDVIIVQALKALDAAGVLDDLAVTVAMTGDEERAGRPIETSRAALIKAAKAADIAVAFENGDNDASTAVIARRGATNWTLRVLGNPAHSSLIFRDDVGAGAIFEAARILSAFYDELAGEEYLAFNPGMILGGTDVNYDVTQARGKAFGKGNVIAEHAIVSGDLRALSLEQRETAKEKMLAIVAAGRPHTQAELIFDDGYPPFAPTDGNLRLLDIVNQTNQDLGGGPVTAVDPMKAGAADVAFTSPYVQMAIDGLGLVGGHDHTVEEFADLTTLPTQTKRAAVLLYRLSKLGTDGAQN